MIGIHLQPHGMLTLWQGQRGSNTA
jgi:hypothetical protein